MREFNVHKLIPKTQHTPSPRGRWNAKKLEEVPTTTRTHEEKYKTRGKVKLTTVIRCPELLNVKLRNMVSPKELKN